MLQKLMRSTLNKYHADNLQELTSNMVRRMRKTEVPDEYAAKLAEKEVLSPRQFEFANMLESNRLADMLPYEWFDGETNIYQTARAHGFVFNCGTVVGCKENLDDQLKSIFNLSIPDGTCMQVLLLASSELEDKFDYFKSLRTTPLLKKQAEERIKFYRQGLKKSLRKGYKLPVRDFKLVISFTFEGVYEESNKAALMSLQQSIGATLKNAYVNNELMQPEQFINLLREILCTKSEPLEKVRYDKRKPIRDQIADIDNNIFVSSDGMCINDMGVQSIGVATYPEEFRITQCGNFVGSIMDIASQISHPFFITQNITFLNQAQENTKLVSGAAKTAQQVQKGKFTALFPLFHKKHAEYQLLQQTIANGESLMLMSHTVNVFYPLGESESAFQEIKSLYKTFGFTMVTNSNIQLPAFLCSLPLYHDFATAKEQKRYRLMSLYTRTNIVNMMPLFADSKGTGYPSLMFLSRRGQLQFFDIFQTNSNFNIAISAKSGSGKSFIANEIVNSAQATGSRVCIIDIGSSYENTCFLGDGQYIRFNSESGMCINPFSFIELKSNIEANSNLSPEEQLLAMEDLDDQITMLKSIFLVSAGIGESDDNYQLADSYFEQAIISSLQKHQTNSTYTTVYDELLELAKVENNNMIKDLANSIKSYTKHGIFGKYFEGQANINLNNELMVLELEELQTKGNLKFIALLILMLKVTQDMYLAPRKQKKYCIIDEAWDLMAGGSTGKFIVTGYRRARRYNGSFTTITQRIDDYAENPTTMACYSNAAIKIMLSQDPPHSVLKPDDYTMEMLSSLKSEVGVYSEFILQIDETKTMCRFITDDFTQFMYSSNANDITLLKMVREEEHLDRADGLARLLVIRDSYINKYNRPAKVANVELLEHINKTSYQNVIRNLEV